MGFTDKTPHLQELIKAGYVPRGPVSVTTVTGNTVRSKGAINSVTLSNSEYIGDITFGVIPPGEEFFNAITAINPNAESSGGGAPTPVNGARMFINPENSNMFPWLSGVAGLYETHDWIQLTFELRTMAGEFAGGTTGVGLGTVMMAINYDSNAPAFTKKAGMLNYDGTVSGKPSASMSIKADSRRALVPLAHLYQAGISPNWPTDQRGDPRFSYLGWLQIGMSGLTGTPTTHQLWVNYTVRLCQPKALNIVS